MLDRDAEPDGSAPAATPSDQGCEESSTALAANFMGWLGQLFEENPGGVTHSCRVPHCDESGCSGEARFEDTDEQGPDQEHAMQGGDMPNPAAQSMEPGERASVTAKPQADRALNEPSEPLEGDGCTTASRKRPGESGVVQPSPKRPKQQEQPDTTVEAPTVMRTRWCVELESCQMLHNQDVIDAFTNASKSQSLKLSIVSAKRTD